MEIMRALLATIILSSLHDISGDIKCGVHRRRLPAFLPTLLHVLILLLARLSLFALCTTITGEIREEIEEFLELMELAGNPVEEFQDEPSHRQRSFRTNQALPEHCW